MQISWTKHLRDPKDKERFSSAVIGAKLVLERQTEIIEDLERAATESSLSKASYDSPSWAYKAADTNGYLRALQEIKQLNNLDQQKQ
jgi:hypothetical protein